MESNIINNTKAMNDDQQISENDEISFEPEEEFADELTLNQKLKKLRQDLRDCQKEKSENLAGWQRAKADYLNLKSSHEETIKELDGLLRTRLIDDLLPVLDAFEMARKNKQAWEAVDSNWRQGIDYINEQLKKTLIDWGMSLIEAKPDDAVDYNLHETIDTVEVDDKDKDHKIAEILQTGYKLKDKIIRPTKVKIYIYKSN